MADTHINAFFADVEEKRQAVVAANGELQAAEVALAAKKQEVGFVEPPAPAVEPVVAEPKQSSFIRKK